MKTLFKTFQGFLVSAAATALALGPDHLILAADIPISAVKRHTGLARDLQQISLALEVPDVQRLLEGRGVSKQLVGERVGRMTPAEVHYVASRLAEGVKAGGRSHYNDGEDTLEDVLIFVGILAAVLIIAGLIIHWINADSSASVSEAPKPLDPTPPADGPRSVHPLQNALALSPVGPSGDGPYLFE